MRRHKGEIGEGSERQVRKVRALNGYSEKIINRIFVGRSIISMGKPGHDPRRSRVDLCRSRVDLCRSSLDVCRSEVKRKILIFLTICHCQKLKIFW